MQGKKRDEVSTHRTTHQSIALCVALIGKGLRPFSNNTKFYRHKWRGFNREGELMKQSTLSYLGLASLVLGACSSMPQPSAVSHEVAAPAAPALKEESMAVRQSGVVLYGNIVGGTPDHSDRRPLLQNTERYGHITDNPVHETSTEPVSTFSIDVDTGSYANVRRYLNQGSLPPPDAVRVEELVNYFPYHYLQPNSGHPFSVSTETVDSPWQPHAKIIKIGIAAENRALASLPPANLVFLVDVSGSMESADKLPLVKQTLRLLTRQLRPQDKVTLITYASGQELVLPPTSGRDKEAILTAIDRLKAGGSTAGGAAIDMAYDAAKKAFVKNGINRILLATDGDFNVGVTNFEALKGMVAEKRKAGISLTTLGFGTGNYNEQLMEQLADAGDGNYAYIDTEKEARKVLSQQLTSTLATVAQDVKIQVEFNPNTVSEYRLVGYENRLLNKEDFNNDRVDAGDIGAGHTVTAYYEIIPQGQPGWNSPSRYAPKPSSGSYGNEYAFVKLRYKKPGQSQSILMQTPINVGSKALADAEADTRFGIAVAGFGQLLRGGKFSGKWTMDNVIATAQAAKGADEFGLRQEFVELAQTAGRLQSRAPAADSVSTAPIFTGR